MKVLAVDDDPFILELLPAMFEQADVSDLFTAPSPQAALDKIATSSRPFDCLLLDVDMPGMNGIELCRHIRAIPGYEHKPILMLTAKTDSLSIENAFAAGANDYISKPFNLKDIYNRMRVAERLLVASKTIKGIQDCATTQGNGIGKHEFEVCEKLHLGSIDRLVLSFSLGNYITQLDRQDLANYQVFCVAIDDADTLYGQTSSQEYLNALTTLAETLSELITCPHMLMSYEGAGSFLCITRDPSLPDWKQIEAALQQKMDAKHSFETGDTKYPVELSVGTPIPPNANRTQRVKKTFERALARAQMRYATKCAAA